jgi:hypothetical protein
MSMPHPRTMVIPFGQAVFVTQTSAGYRLETIDLAGRIKHKGLQRIAKEILADYSDDLDDGELNPNSGSPYVVASHSMAIRHHHTAYRLSMERPNAREVALTQDDLRTPMLPKFYYYIRRTDRKQP